jgi:hypothetical protein
MKDSRRMKAFNVLHMPREPMLCHLFEYLVGHAKGRTAMCEKAEAENLAMEIPMK